MSKGPRYHVPFRRRRSGKTDYKRRLALLKGSKPRAVVRKTLSGSVVQFVNYTPGGDVVVASAVSSELTRYDWEGSTGNVPAAYLTGYLAAKRAMASGLTHAVLDIGLHPPTKGGRVFAALKGMLDAGLDVPHGEEVLAEEARIRGEHISPEIASTFDKVKAKLEGIA